MTRADRGSVTAELAVAMPALVLLLVVALSGVEALTVRLRCVDAAREVALAAARGGSGDAAGRAAVPPGATVTIDADGDLVRAVVRLRVRPLGARLPGFLVEGTAVAATEPTE
jgi:hypothetical protein